MKYALPVLIIMLAGMVNACGQPRWVALDPGSSDNTLQLARQACRVDEKMAQLENARSESGDALRKASNNAAAMVVRDNIQLREKAVYTEIDQCMLDQGFRRQ